MICNEFSDNLELYALGVLEGREASALVDHLGTGCPSCQKALLRVLRQNALVSCSVPMVEPPARLRQRIKESVVPASRAKREWLSWTLALAALLMLTVGVTFAMRWESARIAIAQSEQSAQQARLSNVLQILGAPGTKGVSFAASKVNQVHGSVYIHQRLGVAIVIDRLPLAPAGWKYETWLVPKDGAPQPVEPFHPDSGGRAVSLIPGPVNVADLAAVAVSMEPQNSRPTKPTTPVFTATI
jgi:hypothetical protein